VTIKLSVYTDKAFLHFFIMGQFRAQMGLSGGLTNLDFEGFLRKAYMHCVLINTFSTVQCHMSTESFSQSGLCQKLKNQSKVMICKALSSLLLKSNTKANSQAEAHIKVFAPCLR